MARNGFFGVKNAHIAPMTDEDGLTYETPVAVPGLVEIKMETSVETSTTYADNDVWLDKQQDNGGSATISFYDVDGTPEMRKLFARITGYEIADDGRKLLSSDATPEYFAFMCEQPGHVLGKRKCLYKCQLSKPDDNAKTTEDKPEITQLDFEMTWRPVTLAGGTRTSGYESFSDLDDYKAFFGEVDTTLTVTAAAE